MNALVQANALNDGVVAYRKSTDAADICKKIVLETAKSIQGRKYVQVEGWQAIALAHGCVTSSGDVERIEGGFRAIGRVCRMDTGAMIASAEGFVGEDEPTWFGGEVTDRDGRKKTLPRRPDYAIRAMAQTRAISRACRAAFAHVVVMMNAGLSTTPAEEVPDGGFDDQQHAVTPSQSVKQPQKPNGKTNGATSKEAQAKAWVEQQRAVLETLADNEDVTGWKRENAAFIERLEGYPAVHDYLQALITETSDRINTRN